MKVFAISDLHLPADEKPMDIFGAHWENHFEKIRNDWQARVSMDDVVLIPGDLTWAMTLAGAQNDLDRIGELPGRKYILRGNHDYWWNSISRVRDALTGGMYAVQNDSFLDGGVLVAGTRGWVLPTEDTDPSDRKIFEREVLRLEMSLRSARAKSKDAPLICMMHYPPLTEGMKRTSFTELFERYGCETVVYGHLHGAALSGAVRGVVDGIRYFQASCDGTGFKLLAVHDTEWTRETDE